MSKVPGIDGIARAKWATTIGALCDEFGGEVQTGPFGSQLHAADYFDEGIPIVMPQDMQDGSIVCDRIARTSEKHATQLSRHRLRIGDIVYSRRGDVTRFAVVTESEVGWLCGTGSIRIRLNSPDVSTDYLRHYLKQDVVGDWLKHQAKGVTMPNLNTTIVRALPFVYPPLIEQRRIAEVLDRAEALRAKRRAALAQLDSLTESIFLDMFGDPAVNPMGFPAFRLGDLATKFSDGPFGSNLKSSHYVDIGVRVIRLQNIGVGEMINDNLAFISEEHFASLSKHTCLPGDVLVGTMGDPNLRACVQPSSLKVALNKADCVQIRSDPLVSNSAYVCALLNLPAVEHMAQDKIVGQTRLRISMGRLRELIVPVPPIGLQQTFAHRIASVKALKDSQRAALAELDALFASLQHRAFRGEL